MPEVISNPYDDSGYGLATMTTSVNIIPNNYGLVRGMGIFARNGDTTQRIVILDFENGRIGLLASLPVGSPATQAKRGAAKSIPLIIPHIPYNDRILPSDIQGKRQAGTVEAKTLETVMIKRLTMMRNNHAITEEFMSMGALKGKILDGNGTLVHDLYATFGVTKKEVGFAFASSDTDVNGKCKDIVRHIEDNLMGDVMTGVHCFCSASFFDELTSHPNVEKFFLNHIAALSAAGIDADPRKGFNFGGITFQEYRGNATKADGSGAVKFIDDGAAHFFPVGTMETFETYDAPADFMETVNTPGVPVYAKQVMALDGKQINILTESNPLPLCKRPGVLVTGSIA